MSLEQNEILEAAARVTPQWLAGFFDGEGCVHAGYDCRNGLVRLIVSIAQKDILPLTLIKLKFMRYCSGPNRARNHTVSSITFTGRNCIPFLNFIKDYVICKRTQVEDAIELANLINDTPSSVSDENATRRVVLAERIKLNKTSWVESD